MPPLSSSHAITKDVSLTDTASAAKFFLSDGLIITGTHTGAPTKPEELQELRREIELPVIVGSGVTSANLKNYMSAHALIIGSYFKEGGKWQLPLDMKKVQNFLIRLKDVR